MFDLIRQLAAQQGEYNPNSAGLPSVPGDSATTDISAAARQPTPDYGQTSNVAIGNYQMPVFGRPDANNAAIPQNAQPIAAHAPSQIPQQQEQPGIGDRLAAAAGGFLSNPYGGLFGAVRAAGEGLASGSTPENRMAQALTGRGIDPQLAQFISRDPALTRALIPQLVGAKDQTETIKDYNLYASQERAAGRQPMPFLQYQIGLKQASRNQVVQNNQGENSYDKAMGQQFAKRYETLTTGGDKAFATLGTIQTMRKAMDDPNFQSGVGSSFTLPIKQAIVAFGGDPNAAASMETFRATANKAVLDGLGGSLGTGISNADRDFIVNQVPNLSNTPDGNRALLNVMEKKAQRDIQVARMTQQYVQDHGRIDANFDHLLSQWREANPLFSEADRASIRLAAAGKPASDAGGVSVPVKRYNPKTKQMETVQ